MKREVIIVDNFYENPDEVVDYAMNLKYYNPWANDKRGSSVSEDMSRAAWHSSFFKKANECPFKSSKEFISKLEEITGEKINLEHWNKDFPENPEDGTVITPRPDLIDPQKPPSFENIQPNSTSCRWNCVFHAKYNEQPMGSGVHNHVKDTWNSVGMDGWTGLIYLNKNAPRDSGLKTFRNKYKDDFEWMTSPDRWQLLDDYANVYNRLILVRGWMPHVGGSGFGNSVKNGRLYQTLFFKTENIKNIENCKIDFKKIIKNPLKLS